MIKLEYLASKFNEILGTDKYCVYLNSNAFPDNIGERNVVTMNVLRVPFGFTTEEIDAESLTVTLTFDLPCDVYGAEVVIRDSALEKIETALLGRKIFIVEQPDNEAYIVNTFFEQQPPSNPYADSGRITQQIVLSGKVLTQNTKCGALVGNDVAVYINDTRLLKVSRVANAQVGTDSNIPLSDEITLPELHGISRISTKTLAFLYTGKEIEKKFLKIAEGALFDVNEEYQYKVVYPDFTLVVPFKLTGVSSQDSAGVYLQYTLNIQLTDNSREEV